MAPPSDDHSYAYCVSERRPAVPKPQHPSLFRHSSATASTRLPGVYSTHMRVFGLTTTFTVSLACKERKCGDTSASRDENGQVDVWC